MIKLRITIVAAIVAFGAYNFNHYEAVCGDTENRALCELSLQAGESDDMARNAGNGIFN